MAISIRLLQEHELTAAELIFRLAFGTFVGLPQPKDFGGDADWIQHRWKVDPTAAFAAEVDGKLVGSNFAIHWGSIGFFGPLSVHPQFWGQGIAQRLIEPVMEQFSQRQVRQAGLFTFPNSPKHHALYQKFGFYPRFLTFVMAKPIQVTQPLFGGTEARFSQMNQEQQSDCLNACFELTHAVYDGLDLSQEILAVQAQGLGDTILLWDEGLAGFAICHCEAGSEAGSDTCYVKFGAVHPQKTSQQFEQLLSLCEGFGAAKGMSRLLAGVNTSHEAAYTIMVAHGFRTEITGVAMHSPNQPGHNRPDVFVLDDWR